MLQTEDALMPPPRSRANSIDLPASDTSMTTEEKGKKKRKATKATASAKNNKKKTKATSKGVLGKAKPVAGKTKPAPAIKKATGTATAAGKSKPAPLDESAYITNVNSIGEEDPSGKKRDKITATTAVPSESTTIAPSIGKL